MMRRKALQAKPRAREKPERVRKTPSVAVGQFRLAVPAANDVVVQPKTVRLENRHLLDLAAGMPCLLRVCGVCNRDALTTVACHSNWRAHGGKGGLRKADDFYSCWGCSACHRWLDQEGAPKAVKLNAFMMAHADQVLMWRSIAADTRRPPADRKAAKWALDHLNASPLIDSSFQLESPS